MKKKTEGKQFSKLVLEKLKFLGGNRKQELSYKDLVQRFCPNTALKPRTSPVGSDPFWIFKRIQTDSLLIFKEVKKQPKGFFFYYFI